ncbi:MAG: 6-bladed beta-propeller [Flavobacteriaceae bacterium TMED179]|nr:MAG: 6-bladed beta-propeller [Flavobacteriaceae bacterium TMED179]|tara:strand:- start:9974 stop:11020 length:1047 start_codon:yes stop_codon:yes gene_type:complete
MINRRKFIKKTAVGTGIAIPALNSTFGILSCEAEKTSLVGHGDFTYEVDKDWGVQDPSQFPVNDCHEMVLDKNQRIIMTTTHPQNNILIYDRSGKVLEAWGTEFPGAHGLTLVEEGSEEFLFITDPKTNKVCKTDLKGNILMTFTTPPEITDYKKPKEFKPTETTVAPNGDIYIADGYGKDFIIQYNAEGNYIRHFGGRGKADEQFDCAHGITFDHRNPQNPSLLITSRSANEFKYFTLEGQYLETISLPGCYICRPVIKGNLIYFAVIITNKWDTFDGMLAVLDKNNKVISLPGGSQPNYKDGVLVPPVYDQKTFLNPHDVCVDNDDNLYIPQWNSNKTYPLKLTRV